jgi:hypothetical protein
MPKFDFSNALLFPQKCALYSDLIVRHVPYYANFKFESYEQVSPRDVLNMDNTFTRGFTLSTFNFWVFILLGGHLPPAKQAWSLSAQLVSASDLT